MRRSVRTAAAGASSLTEFLERLRDDGVFRERHSERNPGEITGYAVASPDSVDSTGKPIYYGGGKLAADLTLPELRRRWEVATPQDAADIAGDGPRAAQSSRSAGTASAPEGAGGGREGSAGEDRHAVTLGERAQICEQATAAAARATEQTQASASTDPHAAANAAWAASDFLSVAGRVVEGRRGGPLTDAAGEYHRAARESWGRIPAPSRRLRAAHCGRAADRRPVRRPQRESAAARPTRPTGRPDRRGDPVAGEPEKGRAGRRRAPRRRAAALDRRAARQRARRPAGHHRDPGAPLASVSRPRSNATRTNPRAAGLEPRASTVTQDDPLSTEPGRQVRLARGGTGSPRTRGPTTRVEGGAIPTRRPACPSPVAGRRATVQPADRSAARR
jgi:hypothetical protein